jgi:hypothetical protein
VGLICLIKFINFLSKDLGGTFGAKFGITKCVQKYWRGGEGGEGKDFSDVAADHKNSRFNFWKKL